MDDVTKLDKAIQILDAQSVKTLDMMKERVIGEHVVYLITQSGDVSLKGLMDSLSQMAASTDKSKSLPAEVALTYLQQLVQNRDNG